MNKIRRIGMLTPSSNTTLESLCYRMVTDLPCSIHFSRFPVRTISLDRRDKEQFSFEPMLNAARLLADAQCDIIAWNGTSGGWMGIGVDQELCQRITETTGIPAITTLQAQIQAFHVFNVKNVGLAVPYEESVKEAICRTFSDLGFPVKQEQHLNLRINTEFARISTETLTQLIKDASAEVDGVSVFCTNVAGAPLVEKLEEETGTLIFDSVAVTVWAAIQMVGIEHSVAGWGRLLRENPKFYPVWQ